MAGVAFAVEGDGVGFATESYAASALYTTLASLSGALWRIRRARSGNVPVVFTGDFLPGLNPQTLRKSTRPNRGATGLGRRSPNRKNFAGVAAALTKAAEMTRRSL